MVLGIYQLLNLTLSTLLLCAIFGLQANAKTICTRRQYTIANTVFYQRIEVASAVDCVERCIENVDYCKAVIFLEEREKPKRNFCQLYGVNSDSRSASLQPEANLDPASTVIEILDKCPLGFSINEEESSKDILKKIKPKLRLKIEQLSTNSKDPIDKEQADQEVSLTIDDNFHQPVIYEHALTKADSSVSRDTYRPENPFTATGPRESGEVFKEQPDSEPVPIKPVQVSHNGIPVPGGACPGGVCSRYRPMQRDYPCPARRLGDPCLPRPRCGPPPLPRCVLPQLQPPRVEEHIHIQSYWSSWSMGTCSVTCGIGVRQRKRFCSSPEKNACKGDSTHEESCELPPCDVWSEWTNWSPCSASCGGGQKSRQRFCRNGQNCVGPTEDYRTCGTTPCPTWSQWTPWECSVTCGQGLAQRTRGCLPSGSDCQGPDMETRPCEKSPCSEWSPWTRWSECSKSCGGGERSRHRDCLNGEDCPGPKEEHILCNNMACPTWTEWGSWSGCSATCGDEGTRLRNRDCRFEGYPSNDCLGPAQDQSACQLEQCPTWSNWSPWSVCSATCGHGQQLRTRECEPHGYGCTGGDREIRFCQLAVCPYWSEWSEWGGCSVTCGIGTCERRRKCERDAPLPGAVLPTEDELGLSELSQEAGGLQEDLVPKLTKTELIERSKNNFSTTDSRNGKTVSRDVLKLQEQRLEVAQTIGRPLQTSIRGDEFSLMSIGCIGTDVDRKECDAGPCCGWTPWAGWSKCAGCGTGSRVRTRVCTAEIHGNEFSRSSTYRQDFERSHFSSSVGQSNFNNVRPITPLIGNGFRRPQRQAPFRSRNRETYLVPPPSPPFSTQHCECDGKPIETEVCEAHDCVQPTEPLEACAWSSWGPWCGCAGNCLQSGIQARTRFCSREDYLAGRSRSRLVDCDCSGEKVQTQECRPRHCTSKREPVLEELEDEPMPSSNEKLFKEIEDGEHSCYWSNWSSWSKCGGDYLKQRTRFCVGLKALINDCECMGAAMEQTSCTPERDSHGHTPSRPSFSTDLEASRDILNARLTAKNHASTEITQRDDVIRTSHELMEKKTSKICDWRPWTEWSDCNAECDKEGERSRTRSCSCQMCGSGITKEIESCYGNRCSTNHKRYPFD